MAVRALSHGRYPGGRENGIITVVCTLCPREGKRQKPSKYGSFGGSVDVCLFVRVGGCDGAGLRLPWLLPTAIQSSTACAHSPNGHPIAPLHAHIYASSSGNAAIISPRLLCHRALPVLSNHRRYLTSTPRPRFQPQCLLPLRLPPPRAPLSSVCSTAR